MQVLQKVELSQIFGKLSYTCHYKHLKLYQQSTYTILLYNSRRMQAIFLLYSLISLTFSMSLYFQGQSFPKNFRPQYHDETLKLLQPKDPNKKVVAIIVSLQSSTTYDPLFRQIQQKTNEGTQVLVYVGPSTQIFSLYKGFTRQPTSQIVQNLMSNIKEVDADCVVFNWQCSSGYINQTFPQDKSTVMKFLKSIIDAGHMAMFSDFSLKSLISQWDSTLLGNNPFVKLGQTYKSIKLKFKPQVLKTSPSAQLQMVGKLAERGYCNVKTLSGTIIYSVDKNKIDKSKYKLEVLTIATSNVPKDSNYILEIDRDQGSAGHVLLTYPTGGKILTSMGHWIELMKIDTSQKTFFEIAEREYGKDYAQKLQAPYSKMDAAAKKKYLKSQAKQFVQNQAPSLNMNLKKKS